MSHDANKWEADVRHAVETHEFGYDPEAWAAMEQMLAGANGAAGATAGAGPGWISWKVLLPLLLGIAGLLAWWYWPAKQAAPPPPSPMETPAIPDTPHHAIKPPVEKKSPPLPPAASRPMPEERAPRVQEELLPLPGREEQFLPLPLREEKPASRWVVPPSLPARPPAMLEMPDSLPPELKLLLPKPGKRRRDRKTLFPDVIEKY